MALEGFAFFVFLGLENLPIAANLMLLSVFVLEILLVKEFYFSTAA